MDSSKRIIGIALIGIFYNIFISIFQFALIFLVIQLYGTELNGFVKVSMVLAGIFGVADSAAGINGTLHLFKPLQTKDWTRCNEILSDTNRKHRMGAYIYGGIFVAALFGYTLYTQFTGGITINSDDPTLLPYWKSVLIMFCISSKNLLSLFLTATYENLLSADNNNHYRYIIFLISDSLIYGFTFLLITQGVDVSLVFLPFLAFSLLKSGLLFWFVKYRYPWLKINKNVYNYELSKGENWIAIKFFGQILIANTDIVIIALFFGLNVSSAFSLYMLIITGIREIMITLVIAFRSFFGTWISQFGRVNWKVFRRFELYSYIVGLFTFINMFLLTPYFVDVFYGNIIYDSLSTWSPGELGIYNDIFLRPEFSLLIASISFFIIVSEPANTLIFAKNHFRKTSKFTFGLGVTNSLLMVAFSLPAILINQNYNFALYSIFIIEAITYFILFIYQWIYVRRYLTYNANIKGAKQNILLIFLVFLISIVVMYLFLYPSETLTFNATTVPYLSNVQSWTFGYFVQFFLSVFVISVGGLLSLFIMIHPVKSWKLFFRLPIFKKIYIKYENKNFVSYINTEHNDDLFNIELKNDIIQSDVDDKLNSNKREKEIYIIKRR